MFSDYSPRSRSSKKSLLAVDFDIDSQLLIKHCFQSNTPQLQPVFSNATQEALDHLDVTNDDPQRFPCIILFDLRLSNLTQGWDLFTELRIRYPRLPVVTLSSIEDSVIIGKAYDLGVRSCLPKPTGLNEWEYCFRIFTEYWFNTATLPPRHNSL